jgi:colicin import membrane protein
VNPSVYAKPLTPRIVLRPLLATLVLHGLMLYLLTANWDFGQSEPLRVQPAPPKAINARLVDVSEFQPKPKPKPKPPPRAEPRQSKPAPVAVPKAKPAPKPKPAPVAKPKTVEQPKPVERPRTPPRMTADQLAALARAELEDSIAAEETATAEEMAASYAALIQQTVVGYWSRPPSARNGMETLLQLQLIPTGEVVSVTILKGSGNSAFDRSAVNAVEKAGAFPELQQLPSGEFERNFRRFRLLFRPEDLRY